MPVITERARSQPRGDFLGAGLGVQVHHDPLPDVAGLTRPELLRLGHQGGVDLRTPSLELVGGEVVQHRDHHVHMPT